VEIASADLLSALGAKMEDAGSDGCDAEVEETECESVHDKVWKADEDDEGGDEGRNDTGRADVTRRSRDDEEVEDVDIGVDGVEVGAGEAKQGGRACADGLDVGSDMSEDEEQRRRSWGTCAR
jgi:hypothetical protein